MNRNMGVFSVALAVLALWGQAIASMNYVRTTAQNFADLDGQVEQLNSMGFHVRHILPPNELIVWADFDVDGSRPSLDFVAEWVNDKDISVRAASGDPVYGAFSYLATAPFPEGRANTGGDIETLKSTYFGSSDAILSKSMAPLTAAPNRINANFMLGRTAVALMFMESNGGSENWNAVSKQDMLNRAIQAFDWWCSKAHNLDANISFVYEIHWEIATTDEPIDENPMPEGKNIACETWWTFG